MRKNLFLLFLSCISLHADDDTFRERFADPATRTTALAELIPDTPSAYFHTALDHQLAGRHAEFDKTITAWKTASQREKNSISSDRLPSLENRQLLIDYRQNPDASLAELIRRLDLSFDDTRPDAAATAQALPTRLDPALITEAAFEKAAATESPKAPYTQYEDTRRLRELANVENFDEAEIRWFLGNLDRADHPGIVPLIKRSLGLEKPITFGSVSLHQKLTSGQLTQLLTLHPTLRLNAAFNLAHLTKLRPGTETDFARDLPAHADHLQHCRDDIVTLAQTQNSLKAHVLFHHLRLQQELGNFPKDDFLAFLALPRARHHILRTPENPPLHPVDLATDFSAATGCPPVHEDLPLIQSYLDHFLGQTDSAQDFAPFIPGGRLARIHAEARLLAGESPDRWGAALGPVQFKELQQETTIAFAPGAPILIPSATNAALTLDLKNTPDLLIRIYELDLPAHLARHGREPDVSIDLDGLVPHHQRRLTFAQAPIVRHRETIALPELAGPGTWLVDFVSGQDSARALIRKGQLITYPERTSTGQTVRVFDETGKPVTAAEITLGRETFTADPSGRITIPNAPNQAVTRGIVHAGKLAAPITLGSRTDSLALDARFHLSREQLLADQEARVQLRVRLTNHGHDLPLDRIKEPALILKATLLGGVTTERVIAENLKLEPVFEIPFLVPADLQTLTLTLRGTVTPATGGDLEKLTAGKTYQLNSDLKLPRVATAFFSPTATGHRLELRGRNGEPLPSRALTLKCNRLDYKPAVKLQVRTDENGRVDLGKLDTIDYVDVTGTDITPTFYGPDNRNLDYTSTLQLPAFTEIRLPLDKPAAAPDHLELSLLETLDGKPIRDHFDKFSIQDGQLVIRKLPPGDFILTQGDEATTIQISSGHKSDDLLISPTRILPLHAPNNPTIASATTEDGALNIQVRDASPNTRVTVTGKRYYHAEWSPGTGLYPFQPAAAPTLRPGFLECGFLTDRRLSDEMRYILDRRSALTFPGSLLPRPGLLLHRWTDQDLSQNTLPGLGGIGGEGRGGAVPSRLSKRESSDRKLESSGSKDPTICDFLEMPAVVKFNLTPAPDGSITLPLDDFTGCQFLEIIAADTFADDTLQLALPATDTPLRDRRIARPLDPESHHLATRSAAVLAKGATASIENLLDADWRAFTTLTEAHQFLYGMSADDRLREFTFLTEWPSFDEAHKLKLLSEHPCHELHLFLARKDRAFFEKHVKPLLAQKPEPQFIDNLLLERDLTPYLRPFAWQRLNAAEKALLAQAHPAARDRITRELNLRWDLEAPAPDAETRLFTQTLRGSDLALQDSLGLARTFNVPPDFAAALSDSQSPNHNVDPFAELPVNPRIEARPPISELLKNAGINLPEGSSVTLSGNGKLIVTGAPYELDKIEQLTQPLGSSVPSRVEQQKFNRPAGFANTFGVTPFADSGVNPFSASDSDPFAESPAASRIEVRPPRLTFPDRTRLWREAYYYHSNEPTDESLIPLNRFWIDLAAWDGRGAFVSPHFNACHSSANAALMCLAMLDLPFKAERPEVTVDGSTLRVKAREPMILFYKDTRLAEKIAPESPLLVRQSFSPLAEKFRTVNGRQIENPVTGDFRPGIPYSASLVITNPTGIGRRIDLLAQIPAGAIPLDGKPATLSSTHEIQPHGVVMEELAFYFPAAGAFPSYPLHVSEDGTVLAFTAARILRVSSDPAPQDAASWLVLASEGTKEEVLKRLQTENLDSIDLRAIRWRLKDRDFFLQVSALLRDRLHFSKDIASYAFLHNDPENIRTYLENSNAVRQLGQWLDSPLLTIRPRVHLGWETLEFDPLVNPRAHAFGDHPRMTHPEARAHYQAFLDQLAWKPALDSSDQLTLAAFLFLQDRIGEALARFAKIQPAQLPGSIHYDYLNAVVHFYQEDPAAAKAIAVRNLASLPPGLWRDRFQTVISQADEIAALADPKKLQPPAAVAPEPELAITRDDTGAMLVRSTNIGGATLELYQIDLEMLFSKDPFLTDSALRTRPAISPNSVIQLKPAPGKRKITVGIPNALRKGSLLVSAESGDLKSITILDSRALELRHTPLDRTVQVLDPATSKPLPKTYIKVYAEDQNGNIEFHKDGYTDLRGKFDYLSHTATDPSTIKRLALLISHPRKGARTVIYDR